jgi:hypothetical protein
LYAGELLQKHCWQCGHTSVRSLTRHEHQGDWKASKLRLQLLQATE